MALNEKQILEKVNSQFVVSIDLPRAARVEADGSSTGAARAVPEADCLRFAPAPRALVEPCSSVCSGEVRQPRCLFLPYDAS